jgi:uncharacterized membrane protein HdeD (DUF308 family)
MSTMKDIIPYVVGAPAFVVGVTGIATAAEKLGQQYEQTPLFCDSLIGLAAIVVVGMIYRHVTKTNGFSADK